MILSFSGTGNSRYTAILLGKLLEDEVFSLNELISSENRSSVKSEKPLVFVVPTYCYHIPSVVDEYIKNTELSCPKVYFVMTCGAGIGGAGAANRALCTRNGLNYMGSFPVVMPDNYLVMYEPSSKREAEARVAALPEKLKSIAQTIKCGDAVKESNSSVGRQVSIIGSRLFYSAFVKPEKFRVTDACVSCGSCAKLCPLNNISITDGAPKWGENCVHCLSCICGCPVNAIEYGKGTVGRRRHYLHPDGTLK